MSFSFNFDPRLWFVCRFCKEIFPDTDTLKQHKLKQHLGNCLKIKCIIFEERCLDEEWVPQKFDSSDESSFGSVSNDRSFSTAKPFIPKQEAKRFINPYVSLTSLTSKEVNNIPNRMNRTARKRVAKSKGNSSSLNARRYKPTHKITVDEPKFNVTIPIEIEVKVDDFNQLKIEDDPDVSNALIPTQIETCSVEGDVFREFSQCENTRIIPTPLISFSGEEFHDLSQTEESNSNLLQLTSSSDSINYSLLPDLNCDLNNIEGIDVDTKFIVPDTDISTIAQIEPQEILPNLPLEQDQNHDEEQTQAQISTIIINPVYSEPSRNEFVSPSSGSGPGSSKNLKVEIIDVYPNLVLEQEPEVQSQQSSSKSSVPTSQVLKPFMCQVCHSFFSKSEYLRKHQKTHSEERPCKCPHCPAAYKFKYGLKTHLITHGLAGSNKCRFCDKSFVAQVNLEDHERTHTGDRPFKCVVEKCSSAFTSKKLLQIHIKTIHFEVLGLPQFVCHLCGKSFGINTYLVQHIRKAHKSTGSEEMIIS